MTRTAEKTPHPTVLLLRVYSSLGAEGGDKKQCDATALLLLTYFHYFEKMNVGL
jgi:hypothetical protein